MPSSKWLRSLRKWMDGVDGVESRSDGGSNFCWSWLRCEPAPGGRQRSSGLLRRVVSSWQRASNNWRHSDMLAPVVVNQRTPRTSDNSGETGGKIVVICQRTAISRHPVGLADHPKCCHGPIFRFVNTTPSLAGTLLMTGSMAIILLCFLISFYFFYFILDNTVPVHKGKHKTSVI